GEDNGANPVEYVMAALAGCLTTSLVYHAAAQGITIESVESSYEGELDLHGFLGLSDKVRNGYESLNVTFRIKADAPEEKLRELVELAQRRSPVFDIVSNPVPVTVQLATETQTSRKAAA
ncbi:MAG: OsmC family protein, partial [Acidobacteria bacterium]|nr:OsmC family protein [Acidobacteriota bacterium]